MRLSLTKEAEYALRILVWLAQTGTGPGGGARPAAGDPPVRYKAATIAAATATPPGFATRVLATLQRQGFLDARAGQQGGYMLAQPPSQISLLEIVEAIEGPLLTQTCVLRETRCGTDGHCLLHDAWSTAQAALRDVLARTALSHAMSAPVAAIRVFPDARGALPS